MTKEELENVHWTAGDIFSQTKITQVFQSHLECLAENEKLEKDYRELLWFHHGCQLSYLYGDDGERQCGKCGIDFKREPIERIKGKLIKQTLKELEAE